MDVVAMYKDKNVRAEFVEKGLKVYDELREGLEAEHAGGIVAIDIDSGEHFIGPTLGKANDAAYEKYPDKWICFIRIGAPEAAIALRTW